MLIASIILSALVADLSTKSDCGAFESKRPGLFAPEAAAHRAARSSADGGVAGAPCDPAITDVLDPGPIWRDGNLLYVGNNQDETTNLITVIDASVPGGEFVVTTIPTPVNPVDIAVALDRLYVIDQARNKLYSQPLSGGDWTFISLPNGVITEWDYGHIIEPLGDHMYVIHQWENKIDVVNLVTETVETTITNLDHLPDRIVFVVDGDVTKMVVLGVGLDAPSCFANGPNFSVFTIPDNTKLYRKNIAGACPSELLVRDGKVWVIFDNTIKRYELSNGDFVNQLVVPNVGRNALHLGATIVGQTNGGNVLDIEPTLTSYAPVCDLVGAQVWFPPLEQMATTDDGRVFVTNRNNDTVDRVTIALPPCPGDLDNDGVTDASDLAILLGQWDGPGSADFDGDGVVGAADLGMMLGAWGSC